MTAEIINRIEDGDKALGVIGEELPYEETAIVDEAIPQTRRYANDMGFDELTLIRRKNEVKELSKLYPNIPEFWIEMAWNFHEKTPKEEQDRIIKEKLFEKPCEVNRMLGGVIKGAIKIEQKPVSAPSIDK
jgi:hypothetical protein